MEGLQVWWIINPPRKPVYYPVESVDEAIEKLNELIKRDLGCDGVWGNAGGLEQLEDLEWTEWESDAGDDIWQYMETLEVV